MPPLAFPILTVLPIYLPKPEAQNSHAHAQEKGQKPDDNIPQRRAAAIHTGGRFKAREIAGADPRNHAGHGKGHTHDQHKARREQQKS